MRNRKVLSKFIITTILILILSGLSYAFKYPNIVENVFARGISRYIALVISYISNLVPFSLAELVIFILVIVMFINLFRVIGNLFKRKFYKSYSIIHSVVNFFLLVAVISNISMTVLYNRENSFDHLGLDDNITLDYDLAKEASLYYIDLLKQSSSELERDEQGNVISPYSIAELNEIIGLEYKKLSKEDSFFSSHYNRAKPVFMSTGLSYLGILGIYFPFTSEANINVNTFPYELPTTVAHELAHAKGIMKENEANSIAYYICLTSDDAFLNYSAAMDALRIMIGQIRDNNEYYQEVVNEIPQEILVEYSNASKYYTNYEGFIRELSHKINDLYLKSSGVSDGVKSYSRTSVELTTIYLYLSKN